MKVVYMQENMYIVYDHWYTEVPEMIFYNSS